MKRAGIPQELRKVALGDSDPFLATFNLGEQLLKDGILRRIGEAPAEGLPCFCLIDRDGFAIFIDDRIVFLAGKQLVSRGHRRYNSGIKAW